MNLLGSAISMVSKAVKAASASSNQTFKIVEINLQLTKGTPVFEILLGDPAKGVLLVKDKDLCHVCVFNAAGKSFSVYRDKNLELATDEYKIFSSHSLLFPLADKSGVFSTLIESIHSHPQWKSVHHACALDLTSYFDLKASDPDFKNQINEPAMPDGYFSLHLAAKNGRAKILRKIIAMGASLYSVDSNGMSALHFAAINDPDTIRAFKDSANFADCVDRENGHGATPLHLSLTSGKPDCVKALIECGASTKKNFEGKPILFYIVGKGLINTKHLECLKILMDDIELLAELDASTGNTVLHVTCETQIMNVILRSLKTGHPILNLKNKFGETALICQMKKNNLDCFIKLLSHGADIETRDNAGNTPLLTAAELFNLDFLKTLLIFFAKTDAINKDGENARHLASRSDKPIKCELLHCLDIAGTPKCNLRDTNCSEGCQRSPGTNHLCKFGLSEIDEYAQNESLKRVIEIIQKGGHTENILALDGGGVRGLLLVQTLLCIENALKSGNFLSKFGWIAGTSTGAVIAAALSCGYSLSECQRLYFRLKDEVFSTSMRPYDTAALENFLQNYLGSNKTMADIKNTKLIITTVQGNILPMELHLLRSFELPFSSKTENRRAGYNDPSNQLLWKAVRCSSAAPTFFTSFEDKFIDGGLIANNPTMDLLSEFQAYNWHLRMKKKDAEIKEIGCILSIGTGQLPESSTTTLNLQIPTTIMDYISTALAVKDMTKIMVHQVTESDGRPVVVARAVAHALRAPYFRFSTPLCKEVALDETKNTILIDALWQTMEHMHKRRRDLEDLAVLIG